MNTSKTFSAIAALFFGLSAVIVVRVIPRFAEVAAANHTGEYMYLVPFIELICAVIAFGYWFYLDRMEGQHLVVRPARVIAVTLLVLSLTLPLVLTLWLILLPVYNIASTAS
jgi:hypothetical protein